MGCGELRPTALGRPPTDILEAERYSGRWNHAIAARQDSCGLRATGALETRSGVNDSCRQHSFCPKHRRSSSAISDIMWLWKFVYLLLALLMSGPVTAQEFRANDFDDTSGRQLLQVVDPTSAAISTPAEYDACFNPGNPPNIIFQVFASGMTTVSGTVFFVDATGAENSTNVLNTFGFSAGGCVIGTPIGSGFGTGPGDRVNISSLAYCEDNQTLYAVDFDFTSPHLAQLLSIDIGTGAGTLIGSHMPPDVRIVGMACDESGQLWGLDGGFAASPTTKLVTIDRATGVRTQVGLTGTGNGELQSLAFDPGSAQPRLLAGGTALYEMNLATGAAETSIGSFDSLQAMTAVPEPNVSTRSIAALLVLSIVARQSKPKPIETESTGIRQFD